MASGITISGLSTGIDTDGIISKLMTLAARPMQIVQNKSDDDSAKKSVISTLSSKLATLKTTVKQFTDPVFPFFSQKQVTSTNAQVADAVLIGSNPAAGSFALNVTQLASAAQVSGQAVYTGADSQALAARMTSSAGINAPGETVDPTVALAAQTARLATAPAASGTIVVNGKSVDWNDGMTVNEILGAINNAGAGVTATFDAGAQTFTLRTNTTGSTAQLTLSEGSGNLLGVMALAAGTATGSDAVKPNTAAVLDSSESRMDWSVTSGTFTVNGVVFSVDVTRDSLNDVLGRINNSDAGVTAIFNTATNQVSMFQKTTGAAHQIVLGAAGDTSNALYAMKLSANNPPTGGPADTVSGTNAVVSLNGGPAQEFSSNSINTLLPGVTVNLKSLGNATLNTGADVEAMVSTVKTFVSQYNEVMGFINGKLAEEKAANPKTAEDRIQGAFIVDGNFLDTKDSLTGIVSSVVAGLPSTMNQLAQVGITTSAANFGQDATLELDETKLRAALTSDPDAVHEVFNSASGVMTRMEAKLKALSDPISGTLTLDAKAYDEEIKMLAGQIESMQARLDKEKERLTKQFALMESLVAQMQSQGDQLAKMTTQVG